MVICHRTISPQIAIASHDLPYAKQRPIRCVFAANKKLLLQYRSEYAIILTGVVQMNSVGEYLRKVRDERGLSLNAVYEKTDIKNSTLSRIESGKTNSPSPEHLKKLAAEYQIDLIDLYIKAGYLDCDDLSVYQQCFLGAGILSEDEHIAVQNIIDVIVKKPERCPR